MNIRKLEFLLNPVLQHNVSSDCKLKTGVLQILDDSLLLLFFGNLFMIYLFYVK